MQYPPRLLPVPLRVIFQGEGEQGVNLLCHVYLFIEEMSYVRTSFRKFLFVENSLEVFYFLITSWFCKGWDDYFVENDFDHWIEFDTIFWANNEKSFTKDCKNYFSLFLIEMVFVNNFLINEGEKGSIIRFAIDLRLWEK